MNFCYRQPGSSPGFFVKTLARWALLLLIAFQALGAPDFVPGQVLVKPKAHVSASQMDTLFSQNGLVEQSQIPQIGLRVVGVPEERQAQVLEALSHDPNIEFAEPDYVVVPATAPNDTYYSYEWHLPKISAPAAWDVTTASNNGAGVAALACGCKIMPLRMTDANGFGYASAMADGLVWAADRAVRVANISYGNVSKISSVNTAAQYFQSKGVAGRRGKHPREQHQGSGSRS